MSDINDAFEAATEVVDQQELTEDHMGGQDIREVVINISQAVTATLAGFNEDADPAAEMSRVMTEVALTSFVAGVTIGKLAGDDEPDDTKGILVGVHPDTLEAIGVAAIKDGALSFTLVATTESDEPA